MESGAQQLVERLFTVGEHLPDDLRQAIAARQDETVPLLLALLGDDRLLEADSRGHGWAPIHAVDLITTLSVEAAIPRLLELLAGSGWDEIIHDRIIVWLPKIGPAALEPCLAAYAATVDEDVRASLGSVFAHLGRDPRVLAILVERLTFDTALAATELAIYGDPAALPHLQRALDACAVRRGGDGLPKRLANDEILELCGAIESLGGELTDAQARKRSRALAPDDPFAERVREGDFEEPAPQPGRNDPCWCGSGRKYKKCHLAEDEAGA